MTTASGSSTEAARPLASSACIRVAGGLERGCEVELEAGGVVRVAELALPLDDCGQILDGVVRPCSSDGRAEHPCSQRDLRASPSGPRSGCGAWSRSCAGAARLRRPPRELSPRDGCEHGGPGPVEDREHWSTKDRSSSDRSLTTSQGTATQAIGTIRCASPLASAEGCSSATGASLVQSSPRRRAIATAEPKPDESGRCAAVTEPSTLRRCVGFVPTSSRKGIIAPISTRNRGRSGGGAVHPGPALSSPSALARSSGRNPGATR